MGDDDDEFEKSGQADGFCSSASHLRYVNIVLRFPKNNE